jgi:hypothetical protein
MNKLPERWLRIFVLLLALGLTACGPGGGGTGTGPGEVLNFSGGAVSAPAGGTTAQVGCPSDCARADLQLQDTSVRLGLQCSRFLFEGQWGTDPFGTVTLAGRLESLGTGSTSAATLRIQFNGPVAESQEVTVTLSDEGGRVILGPLLLSRLTSIPPRAGGVCP